MTIFLPPIILGFIRPYTYIKLHDLINHLNESHDYYLRSGEIFFKVEMLRIGGTFPQTDPEENPISYKNIIFSLISH